MSLPKKLGLAVVLLMAMFIAFAQPLSNLAPQGHYIFAVVLVTLGLWIFKDGTLAYFAGGAILLGGSLAFKLPLATVVSGYTSSAVWVLIPALFFGFALVKTGLGKRITYFVLNLFEPGYPSLILSWFIVGLLLSALTPSITVRLAIVMPIALNLVEACKLQERSRGAGLISLVAWGSAVLPGTGWQTGSLWGVFMMGFFPAEVKPLVTFGTWFEYMAVPWLIVTVVFFLLVYILLKPSEPLGLSRAAIQEQYQALGPITTKEMVTALILVVALVLFTTEKYHGLSTAATALLAFAALMITRIITFPEISSGVNWDIINFFGVALSLQAIFAKAGITECIRPIIEPSILSVAGSPMLFLVVITVGFWLIRFIDIPWGFSTIALTAPLFIPLFQKFGLHPAFVAVAVTAAGNCFFLAYQQPFIMVADAMLKNKGWSMKQVSLGGAAYGVAVMASFALSYFYWHGMGLIK